MSEMTPREGADMLRDAESRGQITRDSMTETRWSATIRVLAEQGYVIERAHRCAGPAVEDATPAGEPEWQRIARTAEPYDAAIDLGVPANVTNGKQGTRNDLAPATPADGETASGWTSRELADRAAADRMEKWLRDDKPSRVHDQWTEDLDRLIVSARSGRRQAAALRDATPSPAVEVGDNGGGDPVALKSKLARSTWNYRVVRQTVDGETLVGVHEAYDGGTSWTTEPVAPVSETVEGLREVLRAMAIAPEFDVIDGDAPAPAPAALAVGDRVETAAQLDALPVGIVLRDDEDDVYQRVRDDCGTWTGAYKRVGQEWPDVPKTPARVLDLPGAVEPEAEDGAT